ncbi:LacI family DNA-binding transcriptional regulator [Streptosporangium roseum]|uniref:Transcriptional regulatory DNA-binding repressor transcription regulator protein n=1 Tax=Streptosporangium roseum (strain ATCC 12428 / DSM 43021 / JCM 3005 / KCTC 9067 / NCIMB 10171 / NRRL 2505 / NI 9100) TaxID=479432 RepID=D2B241_STRRD|nr:substrate-binding domain-containing protein [Streptosporangium roseum]ACZ89265.1 transcriptional regulatory DNA-binding repressor transcription regulator protein [Streptosporangium roseum DSM 43021]
MTETDKTAEASPSRPRPRRSAALGAEDTRAHGRRRLSMVDVAAHAGVSVGTVSNVLNRPEIVAKPTLLRVKAAIETLGFVPSAPARQLRAGTSRSVGVVVRDIGNPFFTEVLPGIESRLSEEQLLLVVCSSNDSPEKEAHYLQTLEQHRVPGILITPAGDDIGHLVDLHRRGVGVVLLDRPGADSQLCAVAVDNVRGGELAGNHLLSLGHRRIGFLNGPLVIRQCRDRREGLLRAVRNAGLVPDEVVTEITLPVLNAAGGEAGLDELLAMAGPPPTALFCMNDMVALGALRNLEQRGVTVPGEMAVVGYDDVEFAALLSPSLTSIRQPKQQLGRAAAELLLTDARGEAGHWHQEIVFQPELVVRASSSAPAHPSAG